MSWFALSNPLHAARLAEEVAMARSSLVIPSHEPDAHGALVSVTPEEAGWRDLSFAARRLRAGQRFAAATDDCELALVLLGGQATVESSAGRWERIGRRRNVFDGLPFALYLPPGVAYTIAAETDLEVALAWCPAGAPDDAPPLQARLITPEEVSVEARGGGNAAISQPAGCWSSRSTPPLAIGLAIHPTNTTSTTRRARSAWRRSTTTVHLTPMATHSSRCIALSAAWTNSSVRVMET
jgi:KduI/IolB family